MGCTASKTSDTHGQSLCLVPNILYTQCEEPPIEDVREEGAEAKLAAKPPQKVTWTTEGLHWKRLFLTAQSLVAACLYVVSTWVRNSHHAIPMQFLLSLLLVAPFSLAYHFLSLNKAGGYYDGYVEMFTNFPRHFRDNILKRERNSSQYKAEIEHERDDGIVRTVDGLETGLLFLIVSWFSALVSPTGSANIASDYLGCCLQTVAFFGLHRLYGENVFPGQFYGVTQPEAMWHFRCVQSNAANADWKMTPVLQHPNPSY